MYYCIFTTFSEFVVILSESNTCFHLNAAKNNIPGPHLSNYLVCWLDICASISETLMTIVFPNNFQVLVQ